ncbi:hypothetical protein DSLPV1_190 [Dishui lake phycodnavirus 1]|uniref:hypothetical protein n=1 Tax=Dishui lake phycodnavirus 1 TaxID=2079134 RepID=UPI000CD69AAF|nr:hypothetical protein C5Y57_gp208 [Dishui lake phycodnavirus 1]AUT19161.1 hypothetical protein DSLPV1_190 [Dishui lake phycodnavirus 1]
MDAVLNQVAQLITDQVDIKVEKKLSVYIDMISRKHGISRSELYKDLNAILEKEPLCQGLKKDGTRCKHKATSNGYCYKHYEQRRCTTPVMLQSAHSHSPEIPFDATCPACVADKQRQTRFADFQFPF